MRIILIETRMMRIMWICTDFNLNYNNTNVIFGFIFSPLRGFIAREALFRRALPYSVGRCPTLMLEGLRHFAIRVLVFSVLIRPKALTH
jgi:hypothetical protein